MERCSFGDWSRREIYDFYGKFSNPVYMVSFRQDVTPLHRHVKERGLSFYYGMIWACTRAMNRVDAFRMGVEDGQLVQYEGRNPSFTDLRPGAEEFHIVTMPCRGSMEEFCREAALRSSSQKGFIDLEAESGDLIYFSCLPWLDLTAMTNVRNMNAPGALEDSIPRLSWGKYRETEGRLELGLSVEVNHRFIDGVHIGRFAAELDALLNSLEN